MCSIYIPTYFPAGCFQFPIYFGMRKVSTQSFPASAGGGKNFSLNNPYPPYIDNIRLYYRLCLADFLRIAHDFKDKLASISPTQYSQSTFFHIFRLFETQGSKARGKERKTLRNKKKD